MLKIQSFEQAATSVVVAYCLCAFVATGVVLFGNAPQVFNQGLHTYLLLNWALLFVLLCILVVLTGSFFWSRAVSFRRPILLAVVLLVTVDLLLFAFDRTAISVRGSALDFASYSTAVNGGTFFLDQPNATSPFGFRSPRIEQKNPPGKRILMLGNSYVAGSGLSFATNYPQVIEAELHDISGNSTTTVFSAGVNGYGVLEERFLYDYLVKQGYHFDVVVLNFYLGGDQTNDIRGTTRIAIAGRAQRIHTDPLLRYFYPLDTTTFRFMVYLNAAFRQNWDADAPGVAEPDATCQYSPGFEAFSREHALSNYAPGVQKRIDMPYNEEAIEALAQDVLGHETRFAIVLLPDYNALLKKNRERFPEADMQWNWLRDKLAATVGQKYPLLDLSRSFEDRPDLFRCNDTHWNDKGNLLGGKTAAEFLAQTVK